MPLSVELATASPDAPGGFEEVKVVDDKNNELRISFHRTIRVPDNDKTYQLPPDFGKFPIYSIDRFAEGLPARAVAKGGVFIPMHQREALWIKFSSTSEWPFAIKVYTGGINAVSGQDTKVEPRTLTKHHRHGDEKQNYLVVPGQLWIDGVVKPDGKVKQFVAVPTGSGYSVEAQIRGADNIAGIQFEITPHKILQMRIPGLDSIPKYYHRIYIKTLTNKVFDLFVRATTPIYDIKFGIHTLTGIPGTETRLIFAGRQLSDNCTLADYHIREGSTLHLVVRLRGGGPLNFEEQAIAPGGSIHQVIHKDTGDLDRFDSASMIMFNVQLFGPKTFQLITGNPALPTPVTAESYAEHGYPFFEMYKEPMAISGSFEELLSVGDMDRAHNAHENVHHAEQDLSFRVVKINKVEDDEEEEEKKKEEKKEEEEKKGEDYEDDDEDCEVFDELDEDLYC